MTHGKRRCALKFSLCLQVLALFALYGGCLTPFLKRVKEAATGTTLSYIGLIMTCSEATLKCQTIDLNLYKDALSNKASMYAAVSVSFGIIAMVTQFFLVQAYCLASCNQSCGKKYSPDVLVIFSILTVLMIVTCVVMFELQMSTFLNDAILINWDYSFGFVIAAAALIFLGGFITICDRTGQQSKKKVGSHDSMI